MDLGTHLALSLYSDNRIADMCPGSCVCAGCNQRIADVRELLLKAMAEYMDDRRPETYPRRITHGEALVP